MITKIEGHQFQMDQPTGNLYTFNGAVAGTASPNNTERNLGKELDLLVVHKPYDGVTMKWGHSIFMPEGAKQDFIGSEPVHFSYLWMTVQQDDELEQNKLVLWDEKADNSLFRAVQTGKTIKFESKAVRGCTLNIMGAVEEPTNVILYADYNE